MSETPLEPMSPPWVNLDEAVDWVQLTYAGGFDKDPDAFKAMRYLEDAVHQGDLVGYGSLDASPIQLIHSYTWTEFNLYSVDGKGQINSRAGQQIDSYIFMSIKTYREATLNDLSYPSMITGVTVPGPNQTREVGYHRVLSEVIFPQKELEKCFPADGRKALKTSLKGKYADAIRALDEGKYALSRCGKSNAEIAREITPFLDNKTLKPAAVEMGVKRYYASLGA